MRSHSIVGAAAVAAWGFFTVSLAGQSAQVPKCESSLYSPVDGRLTPQLIGVLPKGHDSVVGFEVINGKPLIAFPHSLLVLRGAGGARFAVAQTVKGLSFNQGSRVLLQSDQGFLQLQQNGLEPATKLGSAVHGRLYGSGEKVFMEVRARQSLLEFVARRDDGAAFRVAAMKGPLRAASWNPQGLAAVVGESLYVWQAGGKSVVRLLTDQGLASARDVVAVGTNRAIVTLRNAIVLVTPETVDMIARMPMSRCRFQNGVLYVLQEGAGLVWSLRGLERLGSKKDDQVYARGLIKRSKQDAAHRSALLAEAARILGCSEVNKALAVE